MDIDSKYDKQDIEEKIAELQDELYGLEPEHTDTEDDKDISADKQDVLIEQPFDADRIRVEQKMLSVKYCKEMLDSHKLHLSPGFQRNKVWRERKRKSLLIESLMLRIPIPAFYFYEDEDSNYYVIDGLQRLWTIQEYLEGGFRLRELQYLQSVCGDMKFVDLPPKYINRIYQTQLAVNVIDSRTPSQVKFDIFRRINTGGVPLNTQEIRNSIAKPEVRQFLKDMTNSEEFASATGGVNDIRMAAQELVLRFIAFYNAFDRITDKLSYEGGNMEAFLDEAFNGLNKLARDQLMLQIHQLSAVFKLAMVNASALFGRYAFRAIRNNDLEEGAKRRFLNRSLFASSSVILADRDLMTKDLVSKRGKVLRILAQELEVNEEYASSLTVGTGDTKRVKTNFQVTKKIIERSLFQ